MTIRMIDAKKPTCAKTTRVRPFSGMPRANMPFEIGWITVVPILDIIGTFRMGTLVFRDGSVTEQVFTQMPYSFIGLTTPFKTTLEAIYSIIIP